MLRTFTIEESTLVLLKRLQKIPVLNGLRLVGGTALALQLGHRNSIDLDFFGVIDETEEQIINDLKTEGLIVNPKRSSKIIKIYEINGVKVDLVGDHEDWFEPPIEMDGVRMARLKDIAALKTQNPIQCLKCLLMLVGTK